MASTIQIKRGTGSAVPTGLADGELAINLDSGQLYFGSGSTSINSFRFTNLTADNYIVSSSVTSITTQTLSGSTQFGDSADDTHQFTGAITASGDISSSAYIYSQRFYAKDQLALNNVNGAITLGYDNTYPINIGKSTNPITLYGNISASANISASGTIFTDEISSPSNNLIISSSTVRLTATTDGEANLILEADTDNNDENDNPFMDFLQDGGGVAGQIGISGDEDKWPDGNTLTGTSVNSMVIGMKGGASSTNRELIFATADTVALKLDNTQDAHFTSDITVPGNITANGNIIGDGATDISGIDTITTSGNISSSGGSIFSQQIYVNNKRALYESSLTANLFDGLGPGGRINLGKPNTNISVFTKGSITSSANISASGDVIANTGSFNHLVMDDGEFIANIISAKDTDESPSAQINLKDADNNSIAGFARLGSGGNAHIGQVFLRDNANLKVQIKASGDSYFNGSSVQVGIGNDSPGKELDVTGEIRASGDITANGNIVGDGSTNITNVDTISGDGTITMSDVTIDGTLNNGVPILSFTSSQYSPVGGIAYAGGTDAGNRYALMFAGLDENLVSLCNRQHNGRVDIRANSSTAGPSGEVTASLFTYNSVELLLPVTASSNISSSGTITANKIVSDNIQAGWHGSTTRIKILVSDFIPDDIGRPAMIDDTGSDRWLESHSTGKLFASIPIPTGYKATHVRIYGSATSAITVYEADIDSKTVTSKGTGNIGTEIDITDVTSNSTNYLFLELDQASGEEVYGGYVTIEAV